MVQHGTLIQWDVMVQQGVLVQLEGGVLVRWELLCKRGFLL